MIRYHLGFPETLSGVDFQTLEDDPSTIFALTLTYLNPAWFTFAASNHGEPLPLCWRDSRYREHIAA